MSQKAEHNIETRIWNTLCEDTEFGPELLKLLEIGELIWQRGWAEANAGNFSLRIPDIIVDEIAPLIHDNSVKVSSPKSRLDLTDYNWLLVSANGSRYREFKKLGFQNFVLIASSQFQVNEQQYEKLITFPLYRKPTSECATHLAVQNWLHNNRPQDKVVLHAHPTDWIIL
ncbi:MAG: class II aldolase/adducin family protein, partial [Candidatus Cloacimonadaceae bacterium]